MTKLHPIESRSHAPAWEWCLQCSSVAFVTMERLMCSHAGAWEQARITK